MGINLWENPFFCSQMNGILYLLPGCPLVVSHWLSLIVLKASWNFSVSEDGLAVWRAFGYVMWVKECHVYHPPVITIFLGINNSPNGLFIDLTNIHPMSPPLDLARLRKISLTLKVSPRSRQPPLTEVTAGPHSILSQAMLWFTKFTFRKSSGHPTS